MAAGRRAREVERELDILENQSARLARLRKLLAVIAIKTNNGAVRPSLRDSTIDDLTEVNQLAEQVQDWIETEINRRNLR